ncbi:dihydrofolate reductase-like [Oppia nitens]|uniref:dihydrofolate reductase-like n=1 Tax=Oppia nitens TaxID=1686743 RepID=UPI0023DA5F7D|nr:dihydrofolate reductase-like [Oppia nitens]
MSLSSSSSAVKPFAMIAAVCANNGIGIEGRLPWRLKNEMSYFTRITSTAADGKQNAVIMGRKTWESIPPKYKPLANRLNVVLSKSLTELPKGAHRLMASLSQSLQVLSTDETIDKVFVIGGQVLYEEAIDVDECQYIYLTRIDSNYECDAFFPEVDLNLFKDITQEDSAVPQEVQQENDITYRYYLYQRV